MRVLDDPDRTLVTSDFVRLEVLPKPSFQGYQDQVDFYEEFFANARKIAISKSLLEQALRRRVSVWFERMRRRGSFPRTGLPISRAMRIFGLNSVALFPPGQHQHN